MRRRLNLMPCVVTVLFAALSHGPAMACKCQPLPPVGVCAKASDAVFSGVAVAVRDSMRKIDDDTFVVFRVAWIRVEKAWKGVHADRVVTVQTGSGGGDCGFPFEAGRRYVVFSKGSSRSTNICTCTADVAAPWALIDSLGTPASRAKVTEPREPPR